MPSYQTASVLPLRPVQKPPYSIEAPGYAAVEGETLPRRHPKARDGLLERPADGVDTVWDLLQRSVRLYGDSPAVASRTLVRMHKELKKESRVVDGQATEVEREWTYPELSDYKYLTYREYETLVLQVASGLRKLGLQPGERIHVFAATSVQWLAISHACASQSISLVTAYDTLGASGVEHSLLQSEARAMFIDPHLLAVASEPLKKATSVKYVIYNDLSTTSAPAAKTIDDFKAGHPGLDQMLSFTDLGALGAQHPSAPVPPSSPRDAVFCIMYTSGTGGRPKGVAVTHGNMAAAVAGVHACVGDAVSARERVLAYLPLAHIFELVLENLAVFTGGTLGYGAARTLSDAGVRRCDGDVRAFAPTALVGVPLVFETMRKGIERRVAAAGPLRRRVFWAAVALKTVLVRNNSLPLLPLLLQRALDGAVFAAVRASAGCAQLRFLVNGGSAIAPATQRFLSLVLGAPMVSGYGLTETCGCGALGSPLQWAVDGCGDGAVGPVPAAVDVKLASLPALGYLAGDSPPRGEILVRGPAVARGYFRDEEETRRAWTTTTDDDDEGGPWFRTGDVGCFDADGRLMVIDRVKNLVKMLGGEYVALEKLEAVYRGAAVVQGVMVEADAAHARPIAVVSPDVNALRALARELGVGEEDEGERGDGRLNAAVLAQLRAQGRRAGFSTIEMVAGVLIVQEEWTPANGFVTATQKLNRKAVRDHWRKDIDKVFASISD